MASRGPADALADEAEATLRPLSIDAQRAAWVYETHITDDTEAITARADARVTTAIAEFAQRAGRLAPGSASGEAARKLHLLRTALPLLASPDPSSNEELALLSARLRGRYARGSYRPPGSEAPWDLAALSRRLAESHDPSELADLWAGWHRIGASMRSEFTRSVDLANQGARAIGFADTGAMWRARYDMPAEELVAEVERLWTEVRPLYRLLHAYARRRLSDRYGSTIVPVDGLVPAHLFGNMWAQSWGALYPLLAPEGAGRGFDLTDRLKAHGVDAVGLVRIAERFFVSLGFPPLPSTFWDRSMFVKPVGRDVLCHASAWDIDFEEDLRIKMCIDVTEEEFHVVHHELGHNFYQRAYRAQPFLFRDGANDAFHEAVGDTIGLSVTPSYLARIGLLPSPRPESEEIGPLLRTALEKVAFLPFGLLLDRWRWGVFSGEIPPDRYNTAWWAMRARYQGVRPPVPRTETEFDPGAKAHVPSSTPYLRYFLAAILQFQFHRALAEQAGHEGPLHRFSVYGNRAAGERLRTMFAMGASRPWPDALEAVTGTRRMDAGALLEYFRPLEDWLRTQTEGCPLGWPGDGLA